MSSRDVWRIRIRAALQRAYASTAAALAVLATLGALPACSTKGAPQASPVSATPVVTSPAAAIASAATASAPDRAPAVDVSAAAPLAPTALRSTPCGYAAPFFAKNPRTPGLGETDPEAKVPCRICHFDHQDMYCVRRTYDVKGRVVRETDEATSGETRITYAPGRETTEYLRPDGSLDRKHHRVFDPQGRLRDDWSERDGKTYGLFRREYDAEGHLVTLVDTQGFDKPEDQNVVRFGWEKGRLVTEDLGDGSPLSTMRRWTHTFSADGCVETIERRPFPFGKLHSTETVQRDVDGRIVETAVVGGGSNPKKARFEYESGKLVREITSWGDDRPLTTRYSWDEKGRIKGWSNDGGDQTSFEYECRGAVPARSKPRSAK